MEKQISKSESEKPVLRSSVLIVDDEAPYGDAMGEILEHLGFEVHLARNATEALRALQQLTPDLILLDIMMPEVDGLTLLRMLRTHPERAIIPVLVISARHMGKTKQEALQAGANGFLTKPFSAQELREALGQHLAL